MADSDDDVPPLEDMSELLHQVEKIREEKQENQTVTQNTITSPNGHSGSAGSVSVHGQDDGQKTKPSAKNQSTTKPTVKKETSTFGGMKKGFLFGGATSKVKQPEKTNPKREDDIPLLKPKDPTAKDTQFQMPEVQAAMAASQNLLQNNKEWVTEDLLSEISKNDNVARHLTDPRYAHVLAEFQSNPQAAMKKYAGNKDMESFLKDFCGILGDHFGKMADQQQTSVPVPTGAKSDILTTSPSQQADIMSEEDRKVQQIINDPEMREILMDPQIQRLFECLRSNPDQAQRILQTQDLALKKKIKKLVSAGLLQIQR